MLVTPGLLSTSRWLLPEKVKGGMKTGDATARRGLHDRAKEIPDHQDGPGKRVFLGSCECFGKHSSSGDRIRTNRRTPGNQQHLC